LRTGPSTTSTLRGVLVEPDGDVDVGFRPSLAELGLVRAQAGDDRGLSMKEEISRLSGVMRLDIL
jgi:hypothetical protein